mmetsp:Transcript_57417/g.136477  ORF Transcript_57417/g.136477 Transcript_57417/m.136477 type:complete len:291 (+) Transcript_57417:77-949(+)
MALANAGPEFENFAATAQALKGGDPIDRDFLLEIWTGAGENQQIAINHLLDTPDSKVRRAGAGGKKKKKDKGHSSSSSGKHKRSQDTSPDSYAEAGGGYDQYGQGQWQQEQYGAGGGYDQYGQAQGQGQWQQQDQYGQGPQGAPAYDPYQTTMIQPSQPQEPSWDGGMQQLGSAPIGDIDAQVADTERQLQMLEEQINKTMMECGMMPGMPGAGPPGGVMSGCAGPCQTASSFGGMDSSWDGESESGSENDWWNQPTPFVGCGDPPPTKLMLQDGGMGMGGSHMMGGPQW